ncbi:DUF2680 domain-containing protein [Bacillus sp. EB600]|uniref:DUF2680 domain-containing protein n=1 Tax=Bacillus sp. EB600 TaxID=2806345 RepID=UPI00210E8AED|nr:DUF2680 domain-containing protein [Bacillus sp. EB600]MCQ6282111.1 DUF2680 domain-containing protein [Bacillus sp. EB600]
MAKVLISCMILCGFFFSSLVTQAKEADQVNQQEKELYDPEMNCTKNIKYNWAQRKQLEQVYKRIYRDYSDLIKVYSQAGALPPEQTKIRHIMLNNYIKTFYKRNYRWCSEHESDEWEEEWYNNDNGD